MFRIFDSGMRSMPYAYFVDNLWPDTSRSYSFGIEFNPPTANPTSFVQIERVVFQGIRKLVHEVLNLFLVLFGLLGPLLVA